MKCPNKNSKEWKDLVAQYGEARALTLYGIEDDIPTLQRAEEINNEYGLVSIQSDRNTKDLEIRNKYFPKNTVKSSEVLKKISESNHPLNKVAEHLLPLVKKNDVDITLLNNEEFNEALDTNVISNVNVAGLFQLESNQILIVENSNFRGKGSEPTLLHEILHSLSHNELRNNTEAKKKFDEFYNYLKPKFELYSESSSIGYAFKDTDELLVALFTNADLINELVKIPSRSDKFDNIFSEIFDYILGLFKIKRGSSIYNEAFSLATDVLNEQRELLAYAESKLEEVNTTLENPGYISNSMLIEEAQKPKSIQEFADILTRHPHVHRYNAGNSQLHVAKIHYYSAVEYMTGLMKKFGWTSEDNISTVKVTEGYKKSNWIYINEANLLKVINDKTRITPIVKNIQKETEDRVKKEPKLSDYEMYRDSVQELMEDYEFDNTGFLTVETSSTGIKLLEKNLSLLGYELLQNKYGAYYVALNGKMVGTPQLELFSLGSDKPSDTNVKLNNKLKQFLSKLGFEVRNLDEIRDKDGKLIDAAAKVDFINKLVDIVEGRESMDTLPEEAAHVLFELVINTPVGQSIMNNIQQSAVYKEVVEQYGEVYGYDEQRLKREAAGKMLASIMLGKFNSSDNSDIQRRQKNWLQRVLEFFKKMFIGYSKEMILEELNANIDLIAEKAISEDLEYFEGEVGDVAELYQYIGAPNPDKVKAILDKIEETQKEMGDFVKVGDKWKYKLKDGTIIMNRVSDLVEKTKNKLYGTSSTDKSTLTHSAVTGTVVHKAQELIMNKIIELKGNTTAYSDRAKLNNFKKEVLAEVKKEVMMNEESAEWVKTHPGLDFFDLSYTSFEALFKGTDHLYNQIKTLDPNATIRTEVKIFDKKRSLAGTIDVLVVHSDGSISIADFKTKQLNKNKTEQFSINQRRIWSAQTAEYVQMLKENYGVNEVKNVMIIPTFLKRSSPNTNLPGSRVNAVTQIQMLNKKSKIKDTLRYIPTDSSRLGYKELDDYMQRLKGLQDELDKKLKTGQNYTEIKEELEQLTLLIDKILIDNDVTPMFRQMQSISDAIADPMKFNTMGIEALNSMLNILKLFKGDANSKYFMVSFIQFVDQKIAATTDPTEIAKLEELKTNIALWNAQSDIMINTIVEKIKEVALKEHNIDSDVAVKKEGLLNRMFAGIIDKNNPVFLAFARLIRGAKEETRLKRQEAFSIILEKDKALQMWSERTGISVKKAFQMILTDNKDLINKYSNQFWEDYKKAKKEKNLTWLAQHTEIDLTKLEEKLKTYLDPTKVYNEDILKQRQQLVNKYLIMNGGEIMGVNPVIYNEIGNRNIFGNSIKLNTKDAFVKTLKKEYINDKWEVLSRPGNEELLDYYNMYVAFNEEFFKLTNGRVKRNFIAEIERTTLDNVDEEGITSMFTSPGSYKEAFLKKFEIRENDVEGSFDSEGNPLKNIPLLYSSKLEGKSLSKSEKDNIAEEVAKLFTKDTLEYNEEVNKRERKLLREKGIEIKSTDLSKSLLLLAESVYDYTHLSAVEETAKAYRTVLTLQKRLATDDRGNTMVNSMTKKALEVMNVDPDLISDFDAFTDMHIYKKNTTKDVIFGKDKKYSSSKVLNYAMTYLSTKALGLNLVLAASSATGAQMNRVMMGSEGTFWDKSHMNKATKLLMNPFNKDKAKAFAAIDFFEISSKPMTQERALDLTKNLVSKNLSIRNIFVLHRKGDDLLDNQILLSMMENYVIDKADGKLKNPKSTVAKNAKVIDPTSPTLAEAFVFNETTGKAEIKVEGLTEQQIKDAILQFRTTANAVATRIKGTQTFENQNLANANLLGKAFMQFRNWMPGLITTRGANFAYHEGLGEYDYGRFRVMLGEMVENSVQNFSKLLAEAVGMGFYSIYDSKGIDKELAAKYLEEFKKENPALEITLEEFIELRKRKLQGAATELRIYIMMGLALSLLGALGFDDDDDSVEGLIAKNLYKTWERSFLEISFFFDPNSVTSIVKSPLPVWRLTTDVSTLWRNTSDELFDDVFGEDSNKDKSPRLHYLSKQIPILNQMLELMGYYERNNVKQKGVLMSAIDRM